MKGDLALILLATLIIPAIVSAAESNQSAVVIARWQAGRVGRDNSRDSLPSRGRYWNLVHPGKFLMKTRELAEVAR